MISLLGYPSINLDSIFSNLFYFYETTLYGGHFAEYIHFIDYTNKVKREYLTNKRKLYLLLVFEAGGGIFSHQYTMLMSTFDLSLLRHL